MKYYISDLHFGHKNCLAFDNRPFETMEEHDEMIMKMWNEKIGIDDEVYVLGDISWYGSEKTAELLSRLNGQKYLVKGNHDDKVLRNKKVRDCFVWIKDYCEIEDGGVEVVLCHYPIVAYNKHYYGARHLYGHVHTGWEYNMIKRYCRELSELYPDKGCKMYNVGAMVIGYVPKSLAEIESESEEGAKGE